MRVRRNFEGFTLLEVVISVALFAVGVTVLLSSYLNVINALHNIQVDQHYEQDLAMVRRIALQVGTLEELEDGGDVETGNHGEARWEGELEETLIADLFKVTLRVEMLPEDESDEDIILEQEFYLTRPNWSDPEDRELLRAETKDRYLSEQLKLDRR
tara:strand:- start:776 stop:1246 length:471 start_codon:yes stop_codon:yes gene_type:complete